MSKKSFVNNNNDTLERESFRSILEPLIVLFNKAVNQVLPGQEYVLEYSIPGGIYGYFKNFTPTDKQINDIKENIKELIIDRTPIQHELLSRKDVISYFQKLGRNDIIDLLNSKPRDENINSGLRILNVNGSGELFLNDVKENYDKLRDFKLFKFNKGFFLIADTDFFNRVMPKRLELSKYLKRFNESENTMQHFGITSIAQLNNIIRKGELSEFIKVSEAYQAKIISRIADNIIGHPLKPRVIFIAGPTSSGKTTTANRLAVELKVLKKKALLLSLDSFYLPHSEIPVDPQTGLQNFELITALDLQLFKNTIKALLNYEAVHLPKYYFDGKGAKPASTPTQIDDETYVIVEGIHGLNPQLWHDVMDVESYRLYISALTTINIHDHLPMSTSDHRLIRRVVRDHLFRGYDFNETIKRWPDVMQNEYQSIFPFQESAHAIFNSALIYEIAVFAHYAPSKLNVEKAKSEYIAEQVEKIKRLLSLFIPVAPADIPFTSILREFIGGSSFKY